ncbi:MAG: TonB-dependent receptor [Gemmatimonadota bacterium]|jgi:iron complex outermembrane receptor protein
MRRTFVTSLVASLAIFAFGAAGLSAQGATATLTGRVTAQDGGNAIAGAQISVLSNVTGIKTGGLTREDGRYMIPGLKPGPYRIEVRIIGYGTQIVNDLRLKAGETHQLDFVLGTQAVSMDAIEVFSQRAVDRKTPVAYSNVDQMQMQRQLASRDLPLILNTKPSVYATAQGGGAGDSRINVRGFDQNNVAVMINGVPVNDMENGWVYWSDWDGIGDVSKSIQLQRGLSAVNLATPSIGGSLNIITDPASQKPGVLLKQEFGNDGFLKTTGVVKTGLLNDKYALMAGVVRKTGDGWVQGTWTDAWAYYAAGTFILNHSNRFDLFALGAPQRHGQNLYAQNIGAFDQKYALSLPGYLPAAAQDYPQAAAGRRYNENYNTITMDPGTQAIGTERLDLYKKGFMNERMNFYNKPQINLNWYSQLSGDLLWSTVAYYSGGKGGGTGTIGNLVWDYSGPSRIVNWDATIQRNDTSSTGALGVLRSSRNNQWTWGAISKLKATVSDAVTVEGGVDWRSATIEHYQEVFDLLGGSYFNCSSATYCGPSDFWTGTQSQRGLGQKLNYYETNTVNWIGGYLQGQYASGPATVYGMGGISSVKYSFTDHFRDDGTGKPYKLESSSVPGYQLKAGGLYNLNDQFDVFVNAGYVAKVPILDNVINDVYGILNQDPTTQKYTDVEAGMEYHASGVPLTAKVNVYNTQWRDRSTTSSLYDPTTGQDYYITMTGVNELHRGLELEAAYQPVSAVRLDLSASFGNWKYTDDVSGTYRVPGVDTIVDYSFYIKNLKVGDAPQTQFAYGVSLFPTSGLFLQVQGFSFANYYAKFNPFDRTDPTDRTQSWKVPNYSLFNLHATYDLPKSFTRGLDVQVFAHLFNLFNQVYIQDATDNSSYNAYDYNHSADDAEVFMGAPRTFNMGLKINY